MTTSLLGAGRGWGASPGDGISGTPAMFYRQQYEKPDSEVQAERETHQATLVSALFCDVTQSLVHPIALTLL